MSDVLSERIDLLAYHLGRLEAENAELRLFLSQVNARLNAAAKRELSAVQKPPATVIPYPLRTTSPVLGPIVRRRIA